MNAPPDPSRQGYETRDAEPRWLLLAVVALLALMGVAFALVAGLDTGFERRAERAGEPPHPMATYRSAPTAAPLQADPAADYEAFAARQRELLTSYGWVDPSQDLVRMPIERAMELIAERGLPARASDPEAGR